MNDMSWKPVPMSAGPDEDAGDAPFREFRKGGIIAGLFFVAFLGFAALIPLDAGAFAEGVVKVSGNRQSVQHRDGGIVTSLEAREGELVEAGDVLLTVSSPEIVATERGLTGEAIALQAQKARLIAERDRLSGVPEPIEFANLSDQDREIADEALRGQRLLFRARRASLGNEHSLLGQRVRQQDEQIGGYREQIHFNREQSRLIDEELTGLRELAERGFVSKSQIRMTERAAADLDGNYGSLRAEVARTSEGIGETRLRMVSLDRDMMEQVADDLRTVQVRLSEIMPRLSAAREQVDRAQVRAPASGRVVGLKVFTVGGVVSPGETLMEIVPQDRRLLIEAKASPSDADDLRIGMSTQIRFPALQEKDMPILEGKVANVSADSLEDERTGTRYFRLEVAVPPEQMEVLKHYRADGGIRPGLSAEVLVPLRKRSALSYLIEPLTQTLWRSGREH